MITVIGWAGAVSLLLAYRLVTIRRVRADGPVYLLLNLFGAVGLGLSTAAAHAWPSAVNNLIWLLLGLGPLARALGLNAVALQRPRCPLSRAGHRSTPRPPDGAPWGIDAGTAADEKTAELRADVSLAPQTDINGIRAGESP